MSRLNLLSEQPPIVATVTVDNKKVAFVSLMLEQEIGKHHHFDVTLDYDVMNGHFLSNPEEQIRLIGKPLHIELQQGMEENYLFKGVITHTINEGCEGKHGYLILKGSSPTVLLERGKRWDVFDNMTLKEVCEEVCDGHQNQHKLLKLSSQPAYKSKIPFLMQYGESDWQFLQRLSALSKENLFYTGTELVFGESKELPATKDIDISAPNGTLKLSSNDELTLKSGTEVIVAQ
ncbi:MAG: phage late control D family protein [Candidatus Symbiothrix sp.]|jgi:uncharacterized protein involved in type VI secretion and phage assembly|nr:phage late control D family protein [Candidatus Symbiothrix sp.]